MIAVLMPITLPSMLIRGPPLLPGLMEASVWRKLSNGPDWMLRPLALRMPAVTVFPRPKGLPMARTHSPTSILSELPKFRNGRGASAFTLSRAMSVSSSVPMT